jgi:hypothetical protein
MKFLGRLHPKRSPGSTVPVVGRVCLIPNLRVSCRVGCPVNRLPEGRGNRPDQYGQRDISDVQQARLDDIPRVCQNLFHDADPLAGSRSNTDHALS